MASIGKDPALWQTADGRKFSRASELGDLVVTSMLGFNDGIVLSGLLCDQGRDDMRCPNGGTTVLRSFDAEGSEIWTVELGATESDSIGGARLAGVVGNRMVVETDDSVDWIGPDGKVKRTLPSPGAPVCVLNDGPVALRMSVAGQAPDPGTPVTAVANGTPSEVEFQLLVPQRDQWIELPGGATKVSGTAPFGGCRNGSAEIEGDVVTHRPTLRWDDSGQRWKHLEAGTTASGAPNEVEATASGSGNGYALVTGTGEVRRRAENSLDMRKTAVLFEQVRGKPPHEVSLAVADGDGGLFACATAAQASCQLADSGERKDSQRGEPKPAESSPPGEASPGRELRVPAKVEGLVLQGATGPPGGQVFWYRNSSLTEFARVGSAHDPATGKTGQLEVASLGMSRDAVETLERMVTTTAGSGPVPQGAVAASAVTKLADQSGNPELENRSAVAIQTDEGRFEVVTGLDMGRDPTLCFGIAGAGEVDDVGGCTTLLSSADRPDVFMRSTDSIETVIVTSNSVQDVAILRANGDQDAAALVSDGSDDFPSPAAKVWRRPHALTRCLTFQTVPTSRLSFKARTANGQR